MNESRDVFTHFDAAGRASMVDVSEKDITRRTATAKAKVSMKPAVAERLVKGILPKGDVLSLAKTAGIFAAKKTPELIPLCHPIALSKVEVDFNVTVESGEVSITAKATATDRTGVEMEALTAASIAALTIYDMCKSVQRDIEISSIFLVEKTGGKSGTYTRCENR